jgi:hypothetical protein
MVNIAKVIYVPNLQEPFEAFIFLLKAKATEPLNEVFQASAMTEWLEIS